MGTPPADEDMPLAHANPRNEDGNPQLQQDTANPVPAPPHLGTEGLLSFPALPSDQGNINTHDYNNDHQHMAVISESQDAIVDDTEDEQDDETPMPALIDDGDPISSGSAAVNLISPPAGNATNRQGGNARARASTVALARPARQARSDRRRAEPAARRQRTATGHVARATSSPPTAGDRRANMYPNAIAQAASDRQIVLWAPFEGPWHCNVCGMPNAANCAPHTPSSCSMVLRNRAGAGSGNQQSLGRHLVQPLQHGKLPASIP